jgi:protein SCO1
MHPFKPLAFLMRDHPVVGRRPLPFRLGPWLIGAVITAGVAFIFWFALAQPVKVAPRIRPVPPFAFTDQRGERVSDSDLRGRMVVMSFAYSRCGEACGAYLAELVELRGMLQQRGLLGSQVLFLTLSLDPAYDTPADLSNLAGRLGVDPDSWRFGTDDPTAMKAFIGGELGIYYGAVAADGTLDHDRRVLLIDGAGELRGSYEPSRFTAERVLRDINLMQDEAASSGLMRGVYEASHLFLCYPE